MTPAERLLQRVDGVRRAPGGWTARCPAHDDRTPSLSIAEADGTGRAPTGSLLLKCHAGCSTASILAAVWLALPDLYPEAARAGVRWLRDFVYANESGEVLYRVRRGESPGGRNRRWCVEHPSGTEWAKGYADERRVLYRLPQLVANPDLLVWVTEGERDADSLAQHGLLATTVPHGSWNTTDLQPLAGRRVVVVVDNDSAGWRKGRQAQEAVVSAGAELIGTRRPLDGCKDATEHFAAGHSTDLVPIVDLLNEQPPAEPPAPGRSAYRDNGCALSTSAPYGVLLHFVQIGKLTPLDIAVWMLMEGRAGYSGIACVTIREVATLVGPVGRVPKEHTISKSIDRLVATGLVAKGGKRGEWRVLNPSFLDRVGSVPRTITFRDRNPTIPYTTSSSTTPHYEPRETPPAGQFDIPETAVRTWTNHPEKGSSSFDACAREGERQVYEAFPGATEEIER